MSINIINKLEKKCLYVEIVVLDKRKSNEKDGYKKCNKCQ